MVSATSSARKVAGSTSGLQFKTCARNIGNEENSRELSSSFEELKNTGNRVAWFLAELCKAEKGVQNNKRNELWTELVWGFV
jgi:hypothetical protein